MFNTRPPRLSFPRSLSVGCDADGKYPLLHDMRRTQSLPPSNVFATVTPWGQKTRALTGIRPTIPTQHPTHAIAHEEHVHPPAPAHDPTRPLPGVPMRRSRGHRGINPSPPFQSALRPLVPLSLLDAFADEREGTRGSITHAIFEPPAPVPILLSIPVDGAEEVGDRAQRWVDEDSFHHGPLLMPARPSRRVRSYTRIF
ncbi:hypothetical protein C8Q80DRAFT_1270364 [Daedaleopsis nitida]|nr:hypothetical protein C8Q80DRAFT_1270364 [Daedaleopsis nitida]